MGNLIRREGYIRAFGEEIPPLERKTVMTESNWGLCKECQWWQTEPEADIKNTTMGLCTEESLYPFRLRVSATSGCNHYSPGEPAHAVGSSAAPPTAEPQR
jgi:hypothetical protein